MVASGPSAANVCLPPDTPVTVSRPPLPSPTRGIRCTLDGEAGRINGPNPVVLYTSGKMVVVLNLKPEPLLNDHSVIQCLTYRGHSVATSAARFSPSGAYICSGDERGSIKVWAFDHPEHLSKYETACLTGPIRDVDWDGESKRLAIVGERMDARSECAKAMQWDGVTAGTLSNYTKGRVASVAFKKIRPFRIVTAGMDEPVMNFHSGPPFNKVPSQDGIPSESAHTRGGVQCVRYSHDANTLVSVGTDKSICIYDGKTMELKSRVENAHKATIYSVAWSADDKHLLTASGDGTCKLFAVDDLKEVKTWNVAREQTAMSFDKVPIGGTQLGCAFCQDMAVSVGLNGQMALLDIASGGITIQTGHCAPIAGLAVDEAHGVFYTGDTNGILCQWDLESTKAVRRLESPEGNPDLMYVVHGTTDSPAAISGVAVSGGTLHSVGWDDKMCVAKGGQVGMEPISLGAQPCCIATGTKLGAIVTVKGILLVKGDSVSSMIPIPYVAKSVCVSSDDTMVCVGGEDCNVHVYSTDGSSLMEIKVIDGKHLKPVHGVALSPDGTKLASGDEKDICVFDVKNDYATLIGRGRWCFHLQRITCLTWSADGSILASGGADDSVYLWNLEKKTKRIHYPYAHRGGLTGLCFLKSGFQLLSVGADSVVNRWDVSADVKTTFA